MHLLLHLLRHQRGVGGFEESNGCGVIWRLLWYSPRKAGEAYLSSSVLEWSSGSLKKRIARRTVIGDTMIMKRKKKEDTDQYSNGCKETLGGGGCNLPQTGIMASWATYCV